MTTETSNIYAILILKGSAIHYFTPGPLNKICALHYFKFRNMLQDTVLDYFTKQQLISLARIHLHLYIEHCMHTLIFLTAKLSSNAKAPIIHLYMYINEW